MNKIKTAIIIALAFFTMAFAFTPVQAAEPGSDCPSGNDVTKSGVKGGIECAKGNDANANTLPEIILSVVNVILFVLGIIAVIMIIYGGIRYVLSAGDATKVTSAKNTIMYSIVGLIVAVLAYAIVNFVIANITEGGSTT